MFKDVNSMTKQEIHEELDALNSLLPHLYRNNVQSILQGKFKTNQKFLQTINCGISANGFLFRNDRRGFLPELMENMYQDRKMFKQKMIEAEKDLEEINAELKRRGLTK